VRGYFFYLEAVPLRCVASGASQFSTGITRARAPRVFIPSLVPLNLEPQWKAVANSAVAVCLASTRRVFFEMPRSESDACVLSEYKSKGLKADDLRRRREEQQVEIRRQKREENISKRRNLNVVGGGDSDDEGGEPPVSCTRGVANAIGADAAHRASSRTRWSPMCFRTTRSVSWTRR
jgi:hypothetical protein